TLYAGLFFIIVQNAVFFLLFFRRPQLKKWLLAQAIIILLYLPWVHLFMSVLYYWTEPQWVPNENNYLLFLSDLFTQTVGLPIWTWLIKREVSAIYVFLFVSAFFAFRKKGEELSLPFINDKYFLRVAWLIIPIIGFHILFSELIGVYIVLWLKILYAMTISVFLFISAFLALDKREEGPTLYFRPKEYFLLVWIILPIAGLYLIHIFIFPILRVRYIGFIHIPLIILFAKGLSRYSAGIKQLVLFLLFCLLFSYYIYPNHKYNSKFYVTYPQDWKSLFARIDAEKSDNTLIATFSNTVINDMYFYFSKGVKYYNHSQEIPMLTPEELERHIRDKGYDSIFIVYYGVPKTEMSIEGYRLKERFENDPIGYVWFKKIVE
ncbi:MAG: hypothetical protein WC321_07445, partial [Candidatus Omnitrophota bacterium]